MSKLPLVYYPSPTLEQPSQKMIDVTAAQRLVPDMIDTMIAEHGIGLAAPQIGTNIQLAIISKDADPSLKDHLAIINPKIYSASRDSVEDTEGCLSIPGVEGVVPRHKKIKVRFIGIDGLETKIKATGLFARVLQHEIDHLNGILFIERATKITQGENSLSESNTL